MTALIGESLTGCAPRLLAGWAQTDAPADVHEHLDRYGPLPLALYANRHGRERLVELVGRAGLLGRGGAGFPTARKLAAVAARRGRATVVANGCEGDPTSLKDRVLLEFAPHLVLDGIVVAAHAVGATDATLCLHRDDPLVATVRAALAERAGDIPITVAEIPGRYVASEASALVNHLTTGDARPTARPPRTAERGVRGRPTLVDNVETLAHLALIARHGDAWFRAAGTPGSPGTALLTVGGAVAHPAVHEIELGLPVDDALELAGGVTEPVRAVLVGGLGGSWLPMPEAASLRLAHEYFRAAEVPFGLASLLALPVGACGVAETARIVGYLAGESAGQCGPCLFGLPAVAADLAALAAGTGAGLVLDRLRGRLGVIPGRGACAHPDGAVRLAASALHVFADDVAAHAAGRPCAAADDLPWTPLPDPTEGWR